MSASSVLLVLLKYQQCHCQFVLLMLGLVSFSIWEHWFWLMFLMPHQKNHQCFLTIFLARAAVWTFYFKVPPIPSMAPLPWLVAKKVPTQRKLSHKEWISVWIEKQHHQRKTHSSQNVWHYFPHDSFIMLEMSLQHTYHVANNLRQQHMNDYHLFPIHTP